MMAKPNATVTIFPKFNPDVMGLMSKKSHVKVDCTSPTVYVALSLSLPRSRPRRRRAR